MNRNIPVPVAASSTSGCPQSPKPPSQAWSWTPPGFNGGSYTILFCFIQLSETIPSVVVPGVGTLSPITYTATELQSVVLPNGKAWNFQYSSDGLGDLTEIAFPTGGTLAYSWASQCLGGTYPNNGSGKSIHTRTLNPNDGVSLTSQWSYSHTCSAQTDTTTVVNPTATNSYVVYTFGHLSTGANIYETQRQYFQGTVGSGTLLKTVKTDYSSTTLAGFLSSINAVPIRQTTIWPNGEQNKVERDYDSRAFTAKPGVFQSTSLTANTYLLQVGSGTGIVAGVFGKEVATREYDYGSGAPGALLRTTSTAYEFQSNSSYLNNNLLDIPSQVAIFSGAAGTAPVDPTAPLRVQPTDMTNPAHSLRALVPVSNTRLAKLSPAILRPCTGC